LRGTHICLRIIEKRKWFPDEKLTPLLAENNELISIFVATIKTAGKKKKSSGTQKSQIPNPKNLKSKISNQKSYIK